MTLLARFLITNTKGLFPVMTVAAKFAFFHLFLLETVLPVVERPQPTALNLSLFQLSDFFQDVTDQQRPKNVNSLLLLRGQLVGPQVLLHSFEVVLYWVQLRRVRTVEKHVHFVLLSHSIDVCSFVDPSVVH